MLNFVLMRSAFCRGVTGFSAGRVGENPGSEVAAASCLISGAGVGGKKRSLFSFFFFFFFSSL